MHCPFACLSLPFDGSCSSKDVSTADAEAVSFAAGVELEEVSKTVWPPETASPRIGISGESRNLVISDNESLRLDEDDGRSESLRECLKD